MNISRTKFGGAVIVAILLAAIASAQERYVWSGVRIQGGKREGKAASAMSEAEIRDAKRADPAAALSKELAEIRLLADVDRKLEEASKRLEDLWIRAAWELDYPGRLEVLVSVAKARSELFAKLGKSEEGVKAAKQLLPDEAAKRAAPTYELVSANAKILEEEQRGLKDPRLVGLASGSAPASSQTRDEIEVAVEQGYLNSQFQVAHDIGPRAAPALEKLVLAKPDEFVVPLQDPLCALFDLAPARGVKFALENYDRGGFFWRKRILRSIMAQDVSKIAIWNPVAVRMVDDPEMRRDALVLLAPLANADAIQPELQAAIVRALEGADSDLAGEVLRAVTNGLGRPSVRPVLEALVQSPIAEIRHTAAAWMRAYASSETMLRCVDHVDPEMRRLLAWFLTPGTFNEQRNERPVIDDRAREILAKLASDSDASVRLQATEAIADLATPLDPAVYRALARDRDDKVLGAFDRMIENLARSGKGQEPWFLAVLTERRANPVVRMGAKWSKEFRTQIFQPLIQTKEGTRAAVGWALEGDDEFFRSVAWWLSEEPPSPRVSSGRFELWMSGDGGGLPALDDKTVERIYRRAFASSRDDVFLRLSSLLCNRSWTGRPRSGAMLPILQDKAGPRELRTYAARVLSTDANVDVEALVAFFTDASWSKGAPTSAEERTLYEIGSVLLEPKRSEIARRVVESKDATDAVALGIVSSTGGALARPVLDRWLTSFLSSATDPARTDVTQRTLVRAISGLPAEHDDTLSKYLLQAIDDPRLRESVISKMGTLRWPEFLDPLGERVRKGESSAVPAVGGYMDDRAAEYLLEAIGRSSYEEFRKACLEQLEAIRKYQDEKARWATRKGGQQARDGAIAQLLPMLDDVDPKIRAQAILSLATLDAVEHLPRIVRFLNDKSPVVQQAAQQALDKLNGREAKKP